MMSISSDDVFDLQRFLEAQNNNHYGSDYRPALSEIKRGRKTSHWLWYIFPQIAGLGNSQYARLFAISGLDEAKAYLAHPILGSRLIECSRAICNVDGKSATDIFGSIDAMKLRSSMTLFNQIAENETVF